MSRKKWLYLVVVVACVAGLLVSGCGAPEEVGPGEVVEPGEEPVEWVIMDKSLITGEKLQFEKGAWVEGMKPGEEDLYFDYREGSGSRFNEFSPITRYWCGEEWQRVTKGHIQQKYIWGGALGGLLEQVDLAIGGVIEIGYIAFDYYPARFPLGNLDNCPGWMTSDLADFSERYAVGHYSIHHPALKAEADKVGLVILSGGGGSKYTLLQRKGWPKAITPEDFKGRSIRVPGYWAKFAEAAGMQPRFVVATYDYEGLQKGMLDITVRSAPTQGSTPLWEVLDYIPTNLALSAGSYEAFANMDWWYSLPEYITQLYFKQVLPEYYRLSAEQGARTMTAALEWNRLQGVELYELPQETVDWLDECATTAFMSYREDCIKAGAPFDAYITDQLAFREAIHGEPWASLDFIEEEYGVTWDIEGVVPPAPPYGELLDPWVNDLFGWE